MPAYKVFPYKGFSGGLNLHDSPDMVGEDQALDALNVLFTTRGSVEQRSGYAQFTAAQGTNRYDSLGVFYKADGTKHLIAGAGNRLEALSTAGAILASSTAPTANPHYFTRFGGPTAEHIYIGNGTDTLRRWTGSVFETPTFVGVTPNGRFLAVSSTDNRLVCARFPGTTAGNNPSTVRFSAEGDPLTWGATDYVDLEPGDGEEIMGVVGWRDLVVVFKQTKFYVFYGNTVDDDGKPVFNYRPVNGGVGMASTRAVAIAEQGLYFMDRHGIYFTDGGQPARVSDIVDPIFHGNPSVYYLGGILNTGSVSQVTMVYHDGRLWFSFPAASSATNNRQLVFDPFNKWWSLCDLPAGPMANFRVSSAEELVFGYAAGSNHIGRYVAGSSYTADDMSQSGTGGNAIVARWLGGWFNYATPSVKTIREAKISGNGLVSVELHHDYKQLPSITQSVELSPPVGLYDTVGLNYDAGLTYGPSTIVQMKLLRKAMRGEAFALGLSNSTINRYFKVHTFVTHVREARVPSAVEV